MTSANNLEEISTRLVQIRDDLDHLAKMHKTFLSILQLRNLPFARTWNTSITRFLVIKACTITARSDGKSRNSMILRWQLRGTKMLTCLLGRPWSSWASQFPVPRLRVQNNVPKSSPIVEACFVGNISMLKDLLSRHAHPNDTTEENFTLLYVS
jgi:hypothetical protein